MSSDRSNQNHGDPGASAAWGRTRAVYEQFVELDDKRRPDFLDRHSADSRLRREVESLAQLDAAAVEHFSRLASRLGPAMFEQNTEPAPTLVGSEVAGYHLLEVLGRGGMGIVYLAQRTDGSIRRPVALKLLCGSIAGPSSQRRFRVERRILERLKHRSIARLLDGGVSADGQPFIAMEYVDGLPIDFWCDAAALSVAERVDLFEDVCSTVQFAHSNEVIHCDIKPSNVLVTYGRGRKPLGRVKLLDFGVARLLSKDVTDGCNGESTAVPLTPAWASPEQLTGKHVTTATDVYCLSALLYRLLVGVPPYDFGRRGVAEIRDQVVATRVVPPDQRLQRLPPEQKRSIAACRRSQPELLTGLLGGPVGAVLMKGLARRPKARYQSPSDLMAELHEVV